MKLIYYFLPQYITNLIYHQSIAWSNRWQYYKSVLYLSRSHILFFSEKGKFLALDLGGTNFRVLIVELNGRDVDIQSKTYLIPQRIMLGTGTQVCKVKNFPLSLLLLPYLLLSLSFCHITPSCTTSGCPTSVLFLYHRIPSLVGSSHV